MAQTDVVPVITPAGFGKGFTVMPKDDEVPFPQALLGVTVIFPEVSLQSTETSIEPFPEIMLAPAGAVQV